LNRKAKSLFVNALTFARVPFIFAWLGFAVYQEFDGGFWAAFWACAMMLLAGLTDAWDGALARKWDVVSTLGKMADPLMDKIFYLVAFPALIWQTMHQGDNLHALVMLGFTILYMLRDTWVTFLRMVGTLYGADVAATWLGKVRTALSFPGAGWVYMYLCFHRFVPTGDLATAWYYSCYAVEAILIVLTLWSLHTYTVSYSPYLRRALG